MTKTIPLTGAHKVMSDLIDVLKGRALGELQEYEGYLYDSTDDAMAAAYQDAADQVRATEAALLAEATSPEAETLATLADDLEAARDKARADRRETGDYMDGKAGAYEHAASLAREYLANLTSGEDRQEEADPAPAPAPHPLDAAIQQTSSGVIWSNVLSVPKEVLYKDIAHEAASAGLGDTGTNRRATCLRMTAAYSVAVLHHLGVDDPWRAMRDEYDRAREKHGDMTLDNPATPDTLKYYALMEEVGEVARCLTYDAEHAGDLATEVAQVGALALAWLATPRQEDQS